MPQERTIEDERVVTGERESKEEKRRIKDNKQIYVVQVRAGRKGRPGREPWDGTESSWWT